MAKLLFPEDVEHLVRRRYQRHHPAWLAGEGAWPVAFALGRPTEREVADDAKGTRAWVEAWRGFQGPAQVRWEDRRWARLGAQRLPSHVELGTPLDFARWLDEDERYLRAASRYATWTAEWPEFETSKVLLRQFAVLADYDDVDWARLTALLRWLLANPRSGLTLRAIPVEGLDTKWLDAPRRQLVTMLLRALRTDALDADFYTLAGLSPLPARVRLRILCPALRAQVGGLADIEAPFGDLASLPLRPARCVIVENLESGLALTEVPGCVAFVAMGNAVVRLSDIPWLRGVATVYWGDLDTHGFAILARARAALTGPLTSALMDAETLLRFQPLWGQEPVQNRELELPALAPHEREVLEGLRAQRWGVNVRLEQERIPWDTAWAKVREAVERGG